MPIVTTWDNPGNTVIRKDFYDPWGWGDYAAALQQTHVMMTRLPEQKIAIILNLTGTRALPPNPLPTLRELLRGGMPENWDGTLVVGGSLFINTIVEILKQGLKPLHRQVETARTLKEAREILAARQARDARC